MIELGKYNELVAYRETEFGWFLTNEKGEEVLLPNKLVPENLEKGDELSVFIFLDSEERLTATTQTPKIHLGEFAFLEVKDMNRYGAFVDWGLDKQLMVPYKEQSDQLEVGAFYLFYLLLDDRTNRLIATNKIYNFLDNEILDVEVGEEVDIIVAHSTTLGVNVIINQKYKGLIFENQIFKKIKYGDQLKGYIKEIREENKIDIVLEKQGYKNIIDAHSQKVLDKLQEHNGYLPFGDKSDPQDIRLNFEMSKKNFKKSIGSLYKSKKIKIQEDGIYLNDLQIDKS